MSKVNAKYLIEQENNLFSSIPEFLNLENRNVEVSFTAPDLSSPGGLTVASEEITDEIAAMSKKENEMW